MEGADAEDSPCPTTATSPCLHQAFSQALRRPRRRDPEYDVGLLPNHIRASFAANYHRTALAGSFGEYSYGQLEEVVTALSQLLPEQAAGSVAILQDEGPVVPACELACGLRWAIFVPLDPTAPVAYLHGQVSTAYVTCLVTTPQYLPKVKQLAKRLSLSLAHDVTLFTCRFAGKTPSHGAACELDVQILSSGACVEGGVQRLLHSDHVEDDAHWVTPESRAPEIQFPFSDSLYIIYTSGSTGRPKAVVGRCSSLLTYLESPCLKRDVNDRVLLCSAVTWDPSVSDTFGTLLHGGCLVLEPRARLMLELVECISSNDVTVVLSTPSLWKMIPHQQVASISCLQKLLLGGEQWCREDIAIPSGLDELYNLYGVTESTVYQAVSRNLMQYKEHRGLYPIFDATDQTPLIFNISETEELILGGCLVLAYLMQSQSERCVGDDIKFYEEPIASLSCALDSMEIEKRPDRRAHPSVMRWFKSGDRVEMSDGALRVLGRVDRQVKLNGFRIELREIESVLSQAPACVAAFCHLSKSKNRIICWLQRRELDPACQLLKTSAPFDL